MEKNYSSSNNTYFNKYIINNQNDYSIDTYKSKYYKYKNKYLDLKKKLSDENQRIGGSGLLPPPLIRSPFTRSGIINAYVKASIMFVKQEKTESENQEIIKEYFDICNTKLDENSFERITFDEFNQLRNDRISNNK